MAVLLVFSPGSAERGSSVNAPPIENELNILQPDKNCFRRSSQEVLPTIVLPMAFPFVAAIFREQFRPNNFAAG